MRRTVFTLGLAVSLLVTSGDLKAQEGDAPDAGDAADDPHLPADSMEIGAKYIGWFLNGEADSLWAYFTPEAQERRSVDDIRGAMDQVMARAGVEAEVIEQKYVMRNGMPQYWHTASFTDFEEPLQIRFIITPEGRVAGVGMNPLSRAPEIDPPGGSEPAPPAAPEPAPADAAEPPAAPPAPESP